MSDSNIRSHISLEDAIVKLEDLSIDQNMVEKEGMPNLDRTLHSFLARTALACKFQRRNNDRDCLRSIQNRKEGSQKRKYHRE